MFTIPSDTTVSSKCDDILQPAQHPCGTEEIPPPCSILFTQLDTVWPHYPDKRHIAQWLKSHSCEFPAIQLIEPELLFLGRLAHLPTKLWNGLTVGPSSPWTGRIPPQGTFTHSKGAEPDQLKPADVGSLTETYSTKMHPRERETLKGSSNVMLETWRRHTEMSAWSPRRQRDQNTTFRGTRHFIAISRIRQRLCNPFICKTPGRKFRNTVIQNCD